MTVFGTAATLGVSEKDQEAAATTVSPRASRKYKIYRCLGGIMATTGRRTRTAKRAHKPAWIADKDNQNKWNKRFVGILKRDYANSDAVISAILRDDKLSRICATKIRGYVDKDCTAWMYGQSKARGAEYKKQLEVAIHGLRVASVLYASRGGAELASLLGKLADGLSGERGRCKEAFATKRHGRDRDHAMLSGCHSFLEAKLNQHVTNVTLANLVIAGHEADGNTPKKQIDEEQVRKNLASFKRNNPLWRNELDPRFEFLPVDPETK